MIGLTNLPAAPKGTKTPDRPGPESGYVVYCEGGRFEGQRGRGAAYDKDGQLIRKFSGNSGGRLHQENFLACVRERTPEKLNTDVQVGHHSTGWCNLANIAFQTGSTFTQAAAGQVKDEIWQNLLTEMQAHLKAHGYELSDAAIKLSPMLEVDVKKRKVCGRSRRRGQRFAQARISRTIRCARERLVKV